MRTTNVFSLRSIIQKTALASLAMLVCGGVAFAGGGEDGAQGVYSSHGGSPWATYYRFLEENPEIYAEADKTFPNGQTTYGQHGETQKNVPGPTIPGKIWPIVTLPSTPQGPEKTMNWAKTMDRITGYSRPEIGSVNLSPGFAALSMGVAGQMLADELQSPQATMPRAREEQNQQIQLSADNTAAMERQQAGCAIDFVASYLYNFTVEEGNKWNQVRNRLFLPMALLLLLPGAVLAQVKSIASQGFSVLGDISPFDGLMRSIIAIFLIPGTYLVVNYGIDVANSITKVVSEEYTKIFGTNMYEDAMCGHIRAFPFREPIENKNFVPNAEAKMTKLSPSNTPFAELEGKMIDIKLTDPCAKLNIVPQDRANEQVKYSVNAQRNAYNTANAALAMAWNILCAFQMAYLYYLWFVGPVVAALWVYPMKQLRDAFPSWCEGVITICFWSLFWSTTVLLMACFRGVDETGTVMMTALNFLATACVKFAFDFAGLVKDAGVQAGRMAEKMASSGGGASKGASGAHGAQGTGVNGHHGGHGTGVNGSHGTGGTGTGTGGTGAGDGTLASSGGGAFGLDGSDGGVGANGLQGSLEANNPAGINGHVSMAGFPEPPLHGHHGNALGVVGTSLGGAALLAGMAALAQPHFMHNQTGLGGLGPHGPGSDPGAGGAGGTHGPGFAGAGPTSSSNDGTGNGTPLANAAGLGAAGLGMDNVTVHEGDEYEHNWGESALNAGPVASASLTADGPPLSSLPANPSLSLTPDMQAAIGMPPSSGADGSPANAIAQGLAGDNSALTGSAGNPAAPNLVAHADGVGVVGVHGHGAPGVGHDAGHPHSAGHGPLHNMFGGDQVAHNQQHAQHHQAGDHHAHELNNLNAMFKESIAMSASSSAAANAAAANAAAASGAAGSISSSTANFNTTDYSQIANLQQSQQPQNIDYTLAAASANGNVSGVAGTTGSSIQYGDGITTTGAGNIDPSAASFSAMAQSVAGDSATWVDDGSVTYSDAGMSTTAAAGDYSTAYGGSSYSTDYSSSAAYSTDYSSASAYSTDYSSVVDDGGTYVDNSYTSASMPTSLSANISSVTDNSSGDSYNNALSAGGFVAPAPDSSAVQATVNSANAGDIYTQVNTSSAMNTTVDAGVTSANSNYSNAAAPSPDLVTNLSSTSQTAANPDIQVSQTQYAPRSSDIVMNASYAPDHKPAHIPMDAAIAQAGAAAAAGSIFSTGKTDAQQQMRNKLAMPEGKPGNDQPKQAKITPPGGKQISGITGNPSKQSALGAALGKAETHSPQGLAKPAAPRPVAPGNANAQPARPAQPSVPKSHTGSLQDSVAAGSTRNRYVQSQQLTEEELAELEKRARENGWLGS